MLAPAENLPIWDFKNTHYVVVIVKEDYPTNFFKQRIYDIRNRKKEFVWSIVTKVCDNKEGDVIEMEVEPYYKKTKLLIEKYYIKKQI